MYKGVGDDGLVESITLRIINIILKTNRDLISRSDLQRFLIQAKREHGIRGIRLNPEGLIEVTGDTDTSIIERMILTNLTERILEKPDARARCDAIAKGIFEEIEDRDAVFDVLPEKLRIPYQALITASLARKYLESIYTMKSEGLVSEPSYPPAGSPAPGYEMSSSSALSTACFGDNRPKAEILLDFCDMLDISMERAERLYDAGYISFSHLKVAPYVKLAQLVGKETATYIRERLGNPVTQQEYLESLGVDIRNVPVSKMRMVIPTYTPPVYHPPPEERQRRVSRGEAIKRYKSQRRRYALSAAILLFAVWGLLYFFWQHVFVTEEKIVPVDWRNEIIYEDPADQTLPEGIDIVRYGISFNDGILTLRIDTAGEVITGAAYGAYIDVDGSDSTGAQVNSLGADIRVQVIPKGGLGFSCSFSRYKNSGFLYESELPCEVKGRTIQIQFPKGTVAPSPDARYSFHSIDTNGVEDSSKSAVKYKKGALYATQIPLVKGIVSSVDSPLLLVSLEAKGSRITISGLSFRASGVSFNFTYPSALNPEESRTVVVTGRSITPPGSSVSIELTGISTDSPYTIAGWGLRGYSAFIPSSISIDGAFSDWNNMKKYRDEKDDSTPLDILEFSAGYWQNESNFYLRTRDPVLMGTRFPLISAITDGDIPSIIHGEDVLSVYIDIDSSASTGKPWHGIGADYMCMISGYGGNINTHEIYEYNGGGWTRIGTIDAEAYGVELEFSVRHSQVNLANATAGFELKNYMGSNDITDTIRLDLIFYLLD